MATEEAVMAVIKASRPSFRNPHDKIAFALHSTFLASGYALVATGAPAFSDTVFSSPPSDEVGIEGWNETEDSYGFVYTTKDRTVLVKCLVMGDCLVIDALSSGDKKDDEQQPINLQINVKEYDGENESKNYTEQYKNFLKLVKTLNSEILKKMEDLTPVKSTSVSALSSAIGGVEGPDRIFAGGFPDLFSEGQIKELLESFGSLRGFELVKDRDTGNSKGYGYCVYQDPTVTDYACAALNGIKMGDNTLTVGRATARSERSDRSEPSEHGPEPYPSGFVVPPILPGRNNNPFLGPGAGMYPRGGHDVGGSMLVGPNDPRWFRPEMPGFLDLVPPGARYDPIGPSGVPGFEPTRFVRNPRRPGTHPDLEHFGNPDFI